jgi:hypothetical protein
VHGAVEFDDTQLGTVRQQHPESLRQVIRQIPGFDAGIRCLQWQDSDCRARKRDKPLLPGKQCRREYERRYNGRTNNAPLFQLGIEVPNVHPADSLLN